MDERSPYDIPEECGRLPRTEANLLRRAREGDDAAYCEIVDRFGASLYRLAFALLGNRADAEDAVQDTFAGAFLHLERFEGRASLRTWLTRILVRQAARCRRAKTRRPTVPLDATLHAVGPAPPDAAAGSDRRLDVLAALHQMPAPFREVLVLREMHDMTYDEIAAALDVPRGTVESRLFRARQALKEQLKDYLS